MLLLLLRLQAPQGCFQQLIFVLNFRQFIAADCSNGLFLHDTDGVPWKIRQNLGDDGRAIYQSFAVGVAKAAAGASEQGRLRVMSPETFAHFLLGAVATSLTRALEDDPQRSLAPLGAELRAGIARLLEETP